MVKRRDWDKTAKSAKIAKSGAESALPLIVGPSLPGKLTRLKKQIFEYDHIAKSIVSRAQATFKPSMELVKTPSVRKRTRKTRRRVEI
jgi:hypothetical protein